MVRSRRFLGIKNTTMEIAGKLTIKDWIDLVGNIEENEVTIDYDSNEKWSLAFYFFEERIRTRYLNPIEAILKMDDNLGEGFAVVNLQCSLIEMIECFINGLIFNYPNFIKPSGAIYNKGSKSVFESFFKERKPFCGLDIDGLDFYKSVRCGLLHETQTKNGWIIRAEGIDKSIENKIIFRNNFQRELEDLIIDYKSSIVEGKKLNNIESIELRKNFISKFNHICKESLEK